MNYDPGSIANNLREHQRQLRISLEHNEILKRELEEVRELYYRSLDKIAFLESQKEQSNRGESVESSSKKKKSSGDSL